MTGTGCVAEACATGGTGGVATGVDAVTVGAEFVALSTVGGATTGVTFVIKAALFVTGDGAGGTGLGAELSATDFAAFVFGQIRISGSTFLRGGGAVTTVGGATTGGGGGSGISGIWIAPIDEFTE